MKCFMNIHTPLFVNKWGHTIYIYICTHNMHIYICTHNMHIYILCMHIYIHASIYIYTSKSMQCIYVSKLYLHAYEPLSTRDANQSSGTCTLCQLLSTSWMFLCRHFGNLWWQYDDGYWHRHPQLPLLLMWKTDSTQRFWSPPMI